MLWSVRKYKIVHVCIIKIQRRVITANDSIYWEIFKSVDCVMPTSYFCKAFDMVPHNSLVMKLDIWMNLMDSIDKKLAGWMHPKSYSQWFHVQIEISNKWCPLGDGNCSKSLLLTLVVGLSSPLASFQRTPSSVMQQLRVGMLSRGMLTGQEGQVQGAVCGLGQPSGSAQTAGCIAREQPHGEGLGDTGGDKLDTSQQCALAAQKANFELSLQVDPLTLPPLQ